MEDATPGPRDDDLAESEHRWREVGKYLDYNWSRYRKYLYVAGMIRFAVLASILSFVVALTGLHADVTVLLIIAALLYAAAALEVLAIWTRRRQIDFYRRYTRD